MNDPEAGPHAGRTPIGRPRLLALDIDGTLLTDDHQLEPAVITAVAAARGEGIELVLASSRSLAGLAPILAQLSSVGWVVALQGGLVASASAGTVREVIARRPLPDGAAERIARLATGSGASPLLYTEDAALAPWMDDRVAAEAEITGEAVTLQPAEPGLGPVYKALCMGDAGEPGPLQAVLAALPSGCAATFSHEHYLEITAEDADKATAVADLATHLGLDMRAVAAIGDGENDIPLLRAAGLAVAMGNAPPAVREVADRTTGTNHEAGVARAIERILAEPRR